MQNVSHLMGSRVAASIQQQQAHSWQGLVVPTCGLLVLEYLPVRRPMARGL